MCVKNAMLLSLNSDTFAGMKEDFDSILAKTIGNMESKGADEAVITVKLGISLTKEQSRFPEDEEKEITKPTFKHDISSVMQVKDKKSGSLSGDYELVWDEDEQKYVMRKIKDGQLTIFGDDDEDTADVEYVEPVVSEPPMIEGSVESDDKYDPAFDVETPFGWLRQFVGEELTVTEAMGNYTVRTAENKIILSSASDEENPFHCSAEKLAPHVGHTVVCVGYGGETLVNIAIECEDCCETLFSIDLDLDEDEDEDTVEAEVVEEAVESDIEEELDEEPDEEAEDGAYEYDAPENEEDA